MFIFNAMLYSFAILGLITACWLLVDCIDLYRGRESPPRGIPRPKRSGWVMTPTPKKEQRGYDTMHPKLTPSVHTLSLLERLYKIEYDELAAGTHDAYRHDPNAQIPKAVHDELDYMDGRASILIVRTINYIRSKSNSAPLEIMPDFDDMLRRIIQRHEDEFNYPPINV